MVKKAKKSRVIGIIKIDEEDGVVKIVPTTPTKADLKKEAKKRNRAGIMAGRKMHLYDALKYFESAMRLDPDNLQYKKNRDKTKEDMGEPPG